jgi:small subunit ribosomal protein S1
VVNNYSTGSLVEGKITNITDFGVFVQLEEGIEGLVHVSEISREKIKTPVGMFNVGDMLKTAVINVSAADRKIGLSLKALEEDGGEEGADNSTQEVPQKQQQAATKASSGPSTFGDLLKAAAGAEEEKEEEEEESSDN